MIEMVSHSECFLYTIFESTALYVIRSVAVWLVKARNSNRRPSRSRQLKKSKAPALIQVTDGSSRLKANLKCRKIQSCAGSGLAPEFQVWRKFAEFAPEVVDAAPFCCWGTPGPLDCDARGSRAPKPPWLLLWDDGFIRALWSRVYQCWRRCRGVNPALKCSRSTPNCISRLKLQESFGCSSQTNWSGWMSPCSVEHCDR